MTGPELAIDDLTWTCHICERVRPDAFISVHTHKRVLFGVPVDENVRYCNDVPACRVASWAFFHFIKRQEEELNSINIVLEADGAWADLEEKRQAGKVIHLGNDTEIGMAALPAGMASGLTSVMIRLDLPDGQTVLAETSLRLLWTAANAIAVRHGEPHMQRAGSGAAPDAPPGGS